MENQQINNSSAPSTVQKISSSGDFKRNVAFKLRIGQILEGKQIFDADKIRFLEIKDKNVVRINLIANITDKYIQEGEKKFGSITLDDATGQIKAKLFGDDIEKFSSFNQGDTVQLVGLLRSWNNELYITPEIIKLKSPQFLLVRKLESDLDSPKAPDKSHLHSIKEKITLIIKSSESNGGVDIDKIIMELKESPELINSEIKKLLEDGAIYEPRPGKLRYLG